MDWNALLFGFVLLLAVIGWTRARDWRDAYERALTFAYHSDRRQDLPQVDREYYRLVLRGNL